MARHRAVSPSAIELDGPFTHDYLHVRGVRLHVAVAGDPADPLVVLLHGAYGAWCDYAGVIAPLAARGFHVAALDLRGYGMSDKPPLPAGSLLRVMAGDVAGVIGALGHEDASLVGVDTGGTIAWWMAATMPERVTNLVSITSAYPVDLRRAMFARPWDFLWLIARACYSRLPVAMQTTRRAQDKLHARYLRINTTSAFQRSDRFARVLDLRRTAARIGTAAESGVHTTRVQAAPVALKWMDAPVAANTLLVHPSQGLWRQVSARAARRVTGSVTTTTIPGTKTMPHIEAPEALAGTVADFLSSV